MIVSMALFAQLAAICAPGMPVATLAAIASTESGFDASAVQDNTTRRRYVPLTSDAGIALATHLHATLHHSVDLGLMQINSANLSPLGMTIADAFDPCMNLGAGAAVLKAAYRPPAKGADTQAALLLAISRYNTGDPARGFTNGYVARVLAAADKVVPVIRQRAHAIRTPEDATVPTVPPNWNVFAHAKHIRAQGAERIDQSAPQEPLIVPPVQRAASDAHRPPRLFVRQTPE